MQDKQAGEYRSVLGRMPKLFAVKYKNYGRYSFMDYLITFLVGGGICVIGQILMDTTKLTAPRILVIFVVAGVAAAGSAPVRASRTGRPSGRRHALAKGAMEGAKEGFF